MIPLIDSLIKSLRVLDIQQMKEKYFGIKFGLGIMLMNQTVILEMEEQRG